MNKKNKKIADKITVVTKKRVSTADSLLEERDDFLSDNPYCVIPNWYFDPPVTSQRSLISIRSSDGRPVFEFGPEEME
ncbi:MAG: hypothetical protein D6719_08015 [Candidatus Dadabacteria bacterium]|nr:MAG: hypothetical protein D6719_08015 [Candidatus Dadabacteria bacterium]